MNFRCPIPKKGLLYAPMEGVTDAPYRMAIAELYPEWDMLYTDFLRLPSEGKFSTAKILEHYGKEVLDSKRLSAKTAFQILASESSNIEASLDSLLEIGIDKLDLNLGCPSKRVNAHGGGAYLLSDLPMLERILLRIRKHFPHFFSVKIRVGFRNDHNFIDVLKLIESCGIEAVTIHARTRDQLYLGRANWDYLETAVKTVNIPVIGNGDIWNLQDIEDCFEKTGCHALMCGRSAMKTPWLSTLYREYEGRVHMVQEEILRQARAEQVELYFHYLEKNYRRYDYNDESILKRFKGLCQYLFIDYIDVEQIRSHFLRSRTLSEFKGNFESLQGALIHADL